MMAGGFSNFDEYVDALVKKKIEAIELSRNIGTYKELDALLGDAGLFEGGVPLMDDWYVLLSRIGNANLSVKLVKDVEVINKAMNTINDAKFAVAIGRLNPDGELVLIPVNINEVMMPQKVVGDVAVG